METTVTHRMLRTILMGGVLLMSLVMTPDAHAQHGGHSAAAKKTAPGKIGVMIIAHGGGPEWDGRVDSLAAVVRKEGRVKGPVAVSFLMGPGAATHRFQDVVAKLRTQGAEHIVVVPLLVSSYSGHYEQIRYLARQVDTLDAEMMHHLEMSGIERASAEVPITVTAALDDAPQLSRIVIDRAQEMAPSAKGRALFIFGHGPNEATEYAAWMSKLRPVADSARTHSGFSSVLIELVRDDAPAAVRAEAVKRARELIQLQYEATRQPVIVVPLLVSMGNVMRLKFPTDLTGLPIEYAKNPLLPHPALADWVESRVRTAFDAPAAVPVASPKKSAPGAHSSPHSSPHSKTHPAGH